MHHRLYLSNQYQYLQRPILWGCIKYQYNCLQDNLGAQLQHPIKQVALTVHSKTSFVRNSDNIKHKTQNPCNENPSLKFTDLLQTQIHRKLVNLNCLSQAVAIPKKNGIKKTTTKKKSKTKKTTAATYKSPCFHHRQRC